MHMLLGEIPDNVALDHRRFDFAHMLVVVFRASHACADQQFVGYVPGHVHNPADSSDAVTFDQKTDNQGASFLISPIKFLSDR